MQKAATAPPKPRKRRPALRFKLDGDWWTVRVGRPPDKEKLDGLCHYKNKTIWLAPHALKGDLLGIVTHELTHAVIPPTDETHVRDLERLVCVVARWAAHTFNDGKISIGQHRRDK
jgi:hypothetical protein